MDEIFDTPIAHTELPSNIQRRLPMYGKHNVQSGDVLTLKRNMTAYMFRHKIHDGNEISDGWTRIKIAKMMIFARLMEEGNHNVDGDAEMYLLTDALYGSIFELINAILTKQKSINVRHV